MSYWQKLINNPLDQYLGPGSDPNQRSNASDVTPNEQETAQLEASFKQLRLNISRRAKELEQRCEECIRLGEVVEQSMNATYSRIKQEQRRVDFQKYEDLLPFSFKEVQWTQSRKVSTPQQNDKWDDLQRLSETLKGLDQKLQHMYAASKERWKSVQQSIEKTFNQFNSELDATEQEINTEMKSHRKTTTNLSNEIVQKFKELEQDLISASEKITNRIEQQMNQLSEQVVDRSKS